MSVPRDLLVAKLTGSAVLSQCSRLDLARLVPFLREQHLQPGEALCRAGQPVSDMWLVLEGTLRLQRADEPAHEVSDGLVGEEAALGLGCYLSDIVAVGQARVVALGRAVAPAGLRGRNVRAQAFWRSLIRAFSPVPFAEPPITGERDPLTAGIAARKFLGWITAVVVPVALMRSVGTSLQWDQRQLAAALASTAMLWIFGAVPPYVAGLLVVLVCVTLGVVPTAVVLSGFASNGFFLALSVFTLGAVLIESGVINRIFLLLVKGCPRRAICYDLTALLVGVLLTPIISSAQDRARVLAPLAVESAQTLGYDPGSRDGTRLLLSMFMGLALFSPMFLTGAPLNLMLYGSLPEQVQDAVPGLRWAATSLAATMVMAGAFLAAYVLVFRQRGTPRISRRTIDAQLDVLGPIQSREWLAVGGILLFLAAVLTQSAHKIDHRLLTLTVVCGYLVLGTLGKNELNLHIDWSALILLGTLIGLVATIVHVDLHTVIAARLAWLGDIMKYRPRLFIALLAGSVMLAGFVMPLAGALVGLYAVPLAMVNGMSPWVVVFVILLMGDIWLFPYQSPVYRTFRGAVRSNASVDERLFLRFNAAMVVARAVALAVSVVYWESLRVL